MPRIPLLLAHRKCQGMWLSCGSYGGDTKSVSIRETILRLAAPRSPSESRVRVGLLLALSRTFLVPLSTDLAQGRPV